MWSENGQCPLMITLMNIIVEVGWLSTKDKIMSVYFMDNPLYVRYIQRQSFYRYSI